MSAREMMAGANKSAANLVADRAAGQDPDRLTLGRFLCDVAEAYAGREAVVFEGRRLRYEELHADALELAGALVGAGVVKGARVALLMPNCPDWIVAAFAVGTLGGVLVPVSTFATPSERDHILRHSDASILLMQSSFLKRSYTEELFESHPELASAAAGRIRCEALPQLRGVFARTGPTRGAVQSWDDLMSQGEDVPEAIVSELCSEVEPSDDAMVIYTSGSTALPKGVVHRHRAAVTQFWRFAEQFRFDPDERIYSAQPFFWTAGIAMTLGCSLASGGTLLLQEVFDPLAALDLIESERATVSLAWGHQNAAIADVPGAAERDLSSMRKVGASSPLGKLVGAKDDAWGPAGAYGMTETFTLCSSIPSDSDPELRRGTNGRPLPGMEFRIVDPHTGAVLPAGEPGAIEVRGATLMRGYHKVAPENVFGADGYFGTGDGGHFDERGYLHWTGRLGDLIKTGGANVSPREIERILDRCPEILAGLAIGVPHPTLGEIVVVAAVAAAHASPTEESVRAFLGKDLASYKLPRRTFFFQEAELDLTNNDKVRVEPLREAALARLEAEGALIAGHRYGS